MTSNGTIFVTGASGFIGAQLLRDLLLKNYNIIALLHNREESGEIQIKKIFADAKIPQLYLSRVEGVFGDISQHNLGFEQDYVNSLIEKISEVWHLAASLSFRRRDREKNFTVNLEGTKNAFGFAKRIDSRYFFYISTVYIKGASRKILYEKPMPRPVKFINSYEETKWEAENYIIRNNAKDKQTITTIIFRLSIVIGNEGYVPENNFGYYNFLASLYSLKKWLLGLPWIVRLALNLCGIKIKNNSVYCKIPFPCIHNKHLNLIPVDKVINFLSKISSHHRVDKRTGLFIYNIADNNPVSLSVLFYETFRGLGFYIPIIHMHSIILQSLFRLILIISRIFPPLKRFAKSIFYYKEYILNESQYDSANTLGVVGKKELSSSLVTPNVLKEAIRGFLNKVNITN